MWPAVSTAFSIPPPETIIRCKSPWTPSDRIAALILLGAAGLFGAYWLFPHVASRIDRFLDPAAGDNYQVQKSLDAFRSDCRADPPRRGGDFWRLLAFSACGQPYRPLSRSRRRRQLSGAKVPGRLQIGLPR